MAKYQFEVVFGLSVLISMLIMGGFFMWVAHDAQQRWGDVNGTRYRDTLERVRKEEWYQHQKKLQEYELFLQQKQEEEQARESSN